MKEKGKGNSERGFLNRNSKRCLTPGESIRKKNKEIKKELGFITYNKARVFQENESISIYNI